jgi:hypothetical protein
METLRMPLPASNNLRGNKLVIDCLRHHESEVNY